MKVFISFASEDRVFSEKLATALKARGVDVWCYLWEMKAGDSLIDKINEALKVSDHLIVVLSKHSLQSHWVQKELNAGLIREEQQRIKVIPALVDDCKAQFPPLIQEKIYADFREDFASGFKEIRRALNVAGMVDQTIYQGEGGKEQQLPDGQLLEVGKMRVLKRGDKIYADIPQQNTYAEITDEQVSFHNKYFDVEWDNLTQQPRRLRLRNIEQYKIMLPPESDILEKIRVPRGILIIEKYRCKFGAAFELMYRDRQLVDFVPNENCSVQINVKDKVVSFGVKTK